MPVIKVNDTSIHYLERGHGTAILFIHPPILSSINFLYQLSGLSNQYRTIAFDIRGHGKSEPSESPLTYALITQDMKGLMDHLGIEKAFICGYSTGGTIALDFMNTFPDRVLGSIIISGMSEVNTWFLHKEISLATMISKSKGFLPLALSICWSNANNRKMFWKLFQDAKKANPQNVAEYYEHSLKYSCTSELGKIKPPALLIYGKDDKQFLPYGRLLRQRLPNNSFECVPHVKHQIPTKAAQSLNQAIHNFIRVQSSLNEQSDVEQTEQDLPTSFLPFTGQGETQSEPVITK
jgi:pimeloyl-ACP methyl ester carboxylesterase